MLYTFTYFKKFLLYQMDVKTAFLNGILKLEVQVEQPPGFENFNKPNHVCKLIKAFYSLKQARCDCYERLSNFFAKKWFYNWESRQDTFYQIAFVGFPHC